MNELQYIPLLIGLAGVAVGSITSIAILYIQQRSQNKRERANQVFNAALEHFKLAIEVAKIKKNVNIEPFAVFLYHQNQLFELLEEDKLNAESLKNILSNDEVELLSKNKSHKFE